MRLQEEAKARAQDTVTKSISLVEEAKNKASTSAEKLLEDKYISLVVAKDGQPQFVRWTDAARKLARVISLDKFNRIVTIVPYIVSVQDFTGAEMLIKDTGAVMLQTKAADRPHMPQWCLTLKFMAELQSFNGPMVPGVYRCLLCTSCLDIDKESGPACESDIFVCCKCLQPWHLTCDRILAHGPKVEAGAPFGCPMCGA